MNKTRKRESGRSMIEMVGVLAVTGVLTAGAFLVITSATQSQKISRAQDDIANIAMAIKGLSAEGTDFSNLGCGSDEDDICNTRSFLRSLHLESSTPFGDNTFYGIVWDKNYPDVFGIRINKIDTKYCSALNYQSFKDAVAGGCGYTYAVADTTTKKESVLQSPSAVKVKAESKAVVAEKAEEKKDYFSIYFTK